MKPRTKLQFEVLNLSKYYLDDIDNEVLSWAKVACLDHKGFATKKKVICMDCGKSFSPELVNRKRAICPHCNTRIKIEQTRCSTDKQHIYVAKAEIAKEFQVIRNFEIYKYSKKDKESHYYINEVLQHWIKNDGKREVVAKNHNVNWYCDTWTGELEIRNKSYVRYWETANRYDIYPMSYHPDSVFFKDYMKYGINNNLAGLTFIEAIKILPNNPKAETLLKAKQYSLLSLYKSYESKINRFWSSIKICMRNKYFVKDSSMYIDYLELLDYFNKDLRNAHYVCPKNLKREHDLFVKKKKICQGKQEAERRRIKAIEDEKRFEKLKKKFFGIQFSDGTINIKSLDSVQEFMQEGDTMHHCVFTNEYYLKPDSLILTAIIGNKHIETIEVNLKTLKVVQSRGVCNSRTDYHDRIVNLVNKNINLIRQKLIA